MISSRPSLAFPTVDSSEYASTHQHHRHPCLQIPPEIEVLVVDSCATRIWQNLLPILVVVFDCCCSWILADCPTTCPCPYFEYCPHDDWTETSVFDCAVVAFLARGVPVRNTHHGVHCLRILQSRQRHRLRVLAGLPTSVSVVAWRDRLRLRVLLLLLRMTAVSFDKCLDCFVLLVPVPHESLLDPRLVDCWTETDC